MKITINKIVSLIIINGYNFYSNPMEAVVDNSSENIIKENNPNIENNVITANKIVTVDKKERAKTPIEFLKYQLWHKDIKFYHQYPKISEFIFTVWIVFLIVFIINTIGIKIFGVNNDKLNNAVKQEMNQQLGIMIKKNNDELNNAVKQKTNQPLGIMIKKDKILDRNITIIITLLLIIFLLIEYFFIKPKIFYKHYDKKLIFWADKYLNLIFIFIIACLFSYFAYDCNIKIQKIIKEAEKTQV